MEQKIFLEKNRSVFSSNVENAINVALSTKTRLLPNDNVSDEFSLFEQYNRERDECCNFRLVMTVNPVCSNVLFNKKTEIVINEGSSACTSLYDGGVSLNKNEYAPNACNTKASIQYLDAIRNTEYSHKDNGGFVYHCGLDIFNNHMLRKKEFVHINKMNNETERECGNVYNTMMDYCRDGRGDFVKMDLNVKYNNTNGEQTKMHLYQYDTIMPMNLAFSDNCIEKDGWWGFINPGTIEIGNNSGNTISINRMMANNKSCEFIDLYPDRSLFSFIPKFNKYRRRIEKNWDYCITYPYMADYDKLNEVCGGENGAVRANVRLVTNSANQLEVECSCYFKHNLLPGNYVSFYYYLPHYKDIGPDVSFKVYNNSAFTESDFDEYGFPKDDAEVLSVIENKDFVRYNIKVKVQSVGDSIGDHKDRIFSVRYNDISGIYEHLQNFGAFYKKNNGNTDCLYYFRKFKKLKNYKGGELSSDVNKIAFAKNIYGDDVAQVVFTDDVDVYGLLDHNGKPLTEVFFTIVKRNAGYKEWYEKKNYSGDTVEFSHCFGEVTSGIDFCGIENEPFDYNIHYMHNISTATTTMNETKGNTFSAWGETILSGCPKTMESGITIDFDEFYGDIVEYDVYNAEETVIGNVYHRFNTAQRESWDNAYKSIKRDEIISDDYDRANGFGEKWSAETYFVNNVSSVVDTKGADKELMYANISPEGYFYNPHMKVKIGEIEDDVSTAPSKYVNYTNPIIKETDEFGNEITNRYEIVITSPVDYGFYKGDYIAFYNKETSEIDWGEIKSVSGLDITLVFDIDSFKTIENFNIKHITPMLGDRKIYAYWSPNNVPTYAKFAEGAKKFTWRKIVPPSEMIQDDELYDLPFANGRFYIEKNVNFFLKRQDPKSKYGLSQPMFKKFQMNVNNPMLRYNIMGYNPIDFSEIMYTMNNFRNCF